MINFYKAGLVEVATERGGWLKRPGAIFIASALLLSACAHNSQAPDGAAQGAAPVGPNTLNVADAAIAGGDPNMALSVSQSILAADSGNVDAMEHEGDAYYALGRCPAAEAAYQLALQHDAHATAAETGLGRCLLKTDPHAAELAFMQAVQDDPGNANALNDLGISRDLQGNFAGAVDPYQKALLADPQLTAAEVNLGLSLALSGNGQQALQYLGPLATGQQATPKIREDYAAALVASGRSDEAQQVLAIDLPPDQVNTALAGFSALIAQSQQQAPPPPPPPTVDQVPPPVPVAAAPLMVAPPPPTSTTPMPLVAAAPMPVAPTPVVTPAVTPAAPMSPPPAAPAGKHHHAKNTHAPVMAAAVVKPAPAPIDAPPPISMPYSAVIAAEAPAPAQAPVAAQSAAPAAAAPAPVQFNVVPASSPSASTAPATGASVQLAALNSQDDAQREWRKISAAAPALFNGRNPEIEPVTVGDKTFYRLRVSGFHNKAAADHFCGQVVAAGHSCTPANF